MEDKNEETMRLQLDLVDEARATAEQIGDLVLRKVIGAAKDPLQGKFGPN